jgi:hypothetical protein
VGNRFEEVIIHNMSAIGLGRIGVYKNNTRSYVTKLCELFGYNDNFKQHFASQITEQAERVYAVIGQRSSSQLLIDLSAEQLGTHHPWILPNIKIYFNPLTNTLLMAGNMGVEEEIIDVDSPLF